MDNFKAVYKILSTLEKAMDMAEFNPEMISPVVLGVSKERWNKYIQMMSEVDYIRGVEVRKYIGGETVVDVSQMRITLKGLEYLQENSIMQRMYKTAKGFKEVVPGL